jgi:hypothetical protein
LNSFLIALFKDSEFPSAVSSRLTQSKAVSRSTVRKAREAQDALATALQGIALFKDPKFH